MRRLFVLATFTSVLAITASGCGGSSSSNASPSLPASTTTPSPSPPAPKPVKPWRTFRKAELSRIVLQPSNAPADMRYVAEESGPQKLTDIWVLPSQLKEARSYGFVGKYDAVFASKSATSDTRVGESVWLLKDRQQAKRWLRKAQADAVQAQFAPVEAPRLGEESWAARGIFQAAQGQGITHAFRLGNAVFVVLTFGDQTAPTEAGALAAAKAALAHAKASS